MESANKNSGKGKGVISKVTSAFGINISKKSTGSSSKKIGSSSSVPRVRINTEDFRQFGSTPINITSDTPFDNEIMERRYGNLLDEELEEEVEVEEHTLDDTPTSPATEAPTQDIPQEVVDSPPTHPTRGKTKVQRVKTSVVWQFMHQNEEKTKAICNKCKKVFKHECGGSGGGTGGLNRHLLQCSKIEYLAAKAAANLGGSSSVPVGSEGGSNMVQTPLKHFKPKWPCYTT